MSISHIAAINSNNSSLSSAICGIMSESHGLIQGGQLSNRDQFPWITNIFTKPTRDFGTYLFAGTGTLITNRHVVCAANSVAYENYLEETNTLDPLKPYIAYSGKNIKLKLGAKNYKDNVNEADALVINSVQKVKLHPHLRGNKPRIANIAILRIRQAITFTQFIKPACVYNNNNGDNALTKNENALLYAVGHGLDQTGTLSFMRKQTQMTMQSDEICKRFFKNSFKSDLFFCAKGNDFNTPCRHDKMLYEKINGQWYLRAMSSMFKIFRNNTCSLNAPVLYEDISPYSNWILESIV
ncbi:hypothetical protein PVAND_003330 [Polypedilum vanderplanki]|uniref:Peptidase S1 domain-containing protein n=1 Tax=Polypedilum vanderplanki TaxID=319348 RepID=A0A9J6BUQ1_POLVA|nr:hypothetical protein PVAND_003330 [Polypedilum vanderplanki]